MGQSRWTKSNLLTDYPVRWKKWRHRRFRSSQQIAAWHNEVEAGRIELAPIGDSTGRFRYRNDTSQTHGTETEALLANTPQQLPTAPDWPHHRARLSAARHEPEKKPMV